MSLTREPDPVATKSAPSWVELIMAGIDGAAKQITKFDAELIFDYVWSHDGKQFAVMRGTASADIILMKDFR